MSTNSRTNGTETAHAPAVADATEEMARQSLLDAWQRAGREPRYPASDAGVLNLAECREYEIDHGTVDEFIRKRYVVSPPVGGDGRRQWNAIEIVEFIAALEWCRRWQKFSTIQDPKKSLYERAQEEAEAAGGASVFEDIQRYTAEDLLLYLLYADDRRLRDAFYVAAKLKLKDLVPRITHRS